MPHICRTCLCSITDNNFISIGEDSTIKNQLDYCIPEMASNLVINPVMCMPCITTLHSLCEFKHQCLQTEERIRQTIQSGIAGPNAVDLSEAFYVDDANNTVHSHLVKQLRDEHLLPAIKQEWEEENEVLQVNCDNEYEIKADEYKMEQEIKVDEYEIEDLDCKPVGENVDIDIKITPNWILDGNMCNSNSMREDDKQNVFNEIKESSTETELINYDPNKITKVCNSKRKSKVSRNQKLNCKLFKCDICNYTTQIKPNLKRHLKTHTGIKPFQCNKCSFRAARKDNLKLHASTHIAEDKHKELPFKCANCKYGATTKKNLKRHLLTHIPILEKPLKCYKCDYKTAHKSNLKIHVRKHYEEMPFQCQYCDYATPDGTCLTRHVMIHTGQKPYECDKCNYRTSQKYHLKRHLRTHAECKICNYTSTKTLMRRHMKIHTGESDLKLQI